MNKDGNTKKQATRKREREKKENPKKEEEIKEHDGPKSSRGRNHADIKRPAALRALSTCRSKPTKNGGHIPSPSDLSTGAIFHFVTIRKPLLALLVPA